MINIVPHSICMTNIKNNVAKSIDYVTNKLHII